MSKKMIAFLLTAAMMLAMLAPAAVAAPGDPGGGAEPEILTLPATMSSFTFALDDNKDIPQQSGPSSIFSVRYDSWGRYTFNGYVKFDLSGVSVPAESISSAVFTVRGTMNNGKLRVSGIDDTSWDYGITWNNAPQHDPEPIDSVVCQSTDAGASFDITDYFKAKLAAGADGFSLLIENYEVGALFTL
ncbi:MAG: DNRLRE domain-containing protein, partial [Clostridiales bacterium]|nr:DNRLRE domain-containing protein [Clostridiales bacterium]